MRTKSATLTRLERLKESLEEKRDEQKRLEGQLQSAMADLEGLGFSTVEEAEEEVERLNQELTEAETEIKQQLADLEEKYADIIA